MQNQVRLLSVCLLFLASFLFIALLKDSFIMIDLQVNSWAMSTQTDYLTTITIVIAYVFDTISLIAISLVLAVYLYCRNYRQFSAFLLASMIGDALVVSIVKAVVHSSRPLNGLIHESGFSFPSGHVTASIVFCGLLSYLTWHYWKSPKAKMISTALCIAVSLIVAFDRIYLNVHWVSDVFGGYLLGLFWFTFSLWIFRHLEKPKKV